FEQLISASPEAQPPSQNLTACVGSAGFLARNFPPPNAQQPQPKPSQTYLKFPVSLLEHLLRWVAEDSGDATGVAIGIDEGWAVNAILALPFDGEGGIGFLQVDRLGVSAPGQLGCKMVGGIEQPGIAGIGGE